MEFKKGDIIDACQGGRMYKAKVLATKKEGGELKLKVHYQGWKSRWDEWIGLDRAARPGESCLALEAAVAAAEEAGAQQAKAKGKAKAKSKSKGKKSSSSQGGAESSSGRKGTDNAASLPLGAPLKKALVEDWQLVTQQDKVVHLPCSPSVTKILAAFVEEKKVQCGGETDAFRVWQEVAAGVRLYFERSLGTLLLYRSERTQFEQVRSDLEGPGKERSRKRRRSDAGASDSDSGESIADIYGATHLLRLFVKLPELLERTLLEEPERKALSRRLKAVLVFLQARYNEFFSGVVYESAKSKYAT